MSVLADPPFSLLYIGLPESVQIAIFVYRHRLVGADAELALGLIGQVDTLATVFGLEIYEGDMMLGEHRMSHATDLHLEAAVVKFCNYGDVLLATCVDCSSHQFGHLLATANYRYARIHTFMYYITTMLTVKKFCCHNSKVFKFYHKYNDFSPKDDMPTSILCSKKAKWVPLSPTSPTQNGRGQLFSPRTAHISLIFSNFVR